MIKKQIENFFYDSKKVETITNLCELNSLPYPKYDYPSVINWNRFSVLDKSFVLKKELINKGYQVGNFNWPVTLNNYTKSKNVTIIETLDNSLIASEKILNIPVWEIYGK